MKRYDQDSIAVRAATHIAEVSLFNLKDYKKALKYYKFIVLYSQNSDERYQAQKKIAQIVFENQSDYKRSIIEYSRLVEITKKNKEKFFFRKQIAEAYYFLNQFFQSESEIELLMAEKPNDQEKYDLQLLKGNIKLATKKVDEAIEIYSYLLNRYPEKSNKDNIALQLAVCYEEKKDFARAIEVLDEMKDGYQIPQFIDQRIFNLRKRQSHLPGAQGLKK